MQIKFTTTTVLAALSAGLAAFGTAYAAQAHPVTPAGWGYCLLAAAIAAAGTLAHDPAPGGFRLF